MSRVTHVYGPAYLDRVIRVGVPLHAPGDPPLDRSVDGAWRFGTGLTLRDQAGFTLKLTPPEDWPGPFGVVELATTLRGGGNGHLALEVEAWRDDLGGMGSGYAAALSGVLVSALGPEQEPISAQITSLLAEQRIEHRPVRVQEHAADWTLLLSSGAHGDKLPIGFRGCHAAVRSLASNLEAAGPCDLRVVASLPNRLAAEAARAPGAPARMFAPSMRNMVDRDTPVSQFAEYIDILCCNRYEWEALGDREQVAWQVSLLVVTNGPKGSTIRFTTPEGEPGRVHVPAFPRESPPRDTNRAGEAYASTLVGTLLDHGWRPGATSPELVRMAGERASAASALVLDRPAFGFPTSEEVDRALRAGRVGSPVS